MRYLAIVVGRLSALGNWFACMSLIVIAIGVSANALSRYIFKHPFLFADEYAQYLLVAMFYLGIGYTHRAGKNVYVRILVDRIHGLTAAIVNVFVSCLSAIVIGIMMWYSWTAFLSTFRSGLVSLTPMETPLAIPFIFVSIGMSIFFLETLVILQAAIGDIVISQKRKRATTPDM